MDRAHRGNCICMPRCERRRLRDSRRIEATEVRKAVTYRTVVGATVIQRLFDLVTRDPSLRMVLEQAPKWTDPFAAASLRLGAPPGVHGPRSWPPAANDTPPAERKPHPASACRHPVTFQVLLARQGTAKPRCGGFQILPKSGRTRRVALWEAGHGLVFDWPAHSGSWLA
jgi:hypothetical protein